MYTEVLVRDSLRLSPNLLLILKAPNSYLTVSETDVNGVGPHPTLTDANTNLTIIFDPRTYLPSRIRAYEDHQVFGPSTSDFLLYNYTEIDGIQFPRNFKLLYNEDNMLIEMLVDTITVNPTFDTDHFAVVPLSEIGSTILGNPPTPARDSQTYTPAEVFESS